MKTELNLQQRTAVETESKCALVLAGAGSGKTRCLVERISYLIENQQVSPYEILAFTFTRKASNEMKERLEERLGNVAFNIDCATMHSIALNLIQRFGELIGLRPGRVTVYSQWESDFLMKEVAKDIGAHDGKRWKGVKKKDIDYALNTYYSTGFLPNVSSVVNTLFISFIARCKENNALTYGALLIGMQMLISETKEYLHYKHILVDETQDNDGLQWAIALAMSKALGASIFCVGDTEQSIYKFRGAVPEYLIDNQDKFDIYKLEKNYRSQAYIVEAANRLIKHNVNRLDLVMEATR